MTQGTLWRCDLSAQYRKYQDEINTAIQRVLDSGRYTLADELSSFEDEFADYLGVRHAIGVGNATDGLILALKAFGIGPGDEVISTPFTAIPTISAIIATGARPVLVDIDEDNYLIDIAKIPDYITSKTKAVIPVHIFGNVFDVDALRKKIPDRVKIIEDAAQAHGSKINGKHAGTMGDVGVFSFYPTKNLGGYGDGGAIVTNNIDLDRQLKLMRMYGMTDKDHIIINGVNSRLDELQAAILRVKLQYLDEMNNSRNKIANEYKRRLDNNYFNFQKIAENIYCNYHVFTATLCDYRDSLIDYLTRYNIQSNIYYLIPLYLQEANQFLGYSIGDFPITEKLCKEIIALPFYPELTVHQQKRVTDTINKFIEQLKG